MIKCRVSYDRVCKTGGILRVKRMQNYKPETSVSNTFFEIQLETGRVSLSIPLLRFVVYVFGDFSSNTTRKTQ